MERKIIDAPQLRFKADGEADAGLFTGYGSTWDNADSQNERVIKGAFKDTLEEFVRDGFIAIGHDWMGLPVATVKDATEDDTGLLFTAEFHTTDEAQKARTIVRERLERDKTAKLSIGYEVLEDRQGKDKVRELVRLKLFEVSIVTVPANPMAAVTDAKSRGLLERFGAAGLTLQDHGSGLLADFDAYIKRLEQLERMRAKESRVLSSASLKDLEEMLGLMAQAMKVGKTLKDRATAPKDEGKLHREFMRLKLMREAGISAGGYNAD